MLKNFSFSKHSLEQMELRNINRGEIENALNNPQQKAFEDNLSIYQKIIEKNNRSYLLRVFVNELKNPPVVITVYKTSKINKYFKL
jgi:hypothetical protein